MTGVFSSLRQLPGVLIGFRGVSTAAIIGGLVVGGSTHYASAKAPPHDIAPNKPSPVVLPAQWNQVVNPVPMDAAMEAKITELLNKLTLEQKVGQMIQPHIGAVTPEEVKAYNIGSILNGGGQNPNDNPNSTPQDWVQMAEKFYQASMSAENGRIPIPVIWGIDAVHGHSNMVGATLFPHNIALGATRNPALVKALGALTAKEVCSTGQDWDFAPTLAVARDDRWGRAYESFSEDSELVALLGGKFVEGLQGTAGTKEFLAEGKVLATAKHFIGDGGTSFGDDQGFTQGEEQALLRTHLPGYISALNAGVQTVMASYSTWNGTHSHVNARLMNQLLKGQLGFDGFIVSDWKAIGHVAGCSLDNCPEAVNAGVDMFMIPDAPDWKSFHANVVAQVKSGVITQERIDDAVRRILRVKMRQGLFTRPGPAKRAAATAGSLGAPEHRALARQAVRESIVLLKKTQGVLPIKPKARVLVAGVGGNNLSRQSGGWSVTWQGIDVPNEKFPGATSLYSGIAAAMKAVGGTAEYSEQGTFTTKPDIAVVVLGENAYAEIQGDIQNLATLEVESGSKTGLKLIQSLKVQGIPVVAVLLSARPLWVNKELNAADAFVAAWQPGTEGSGVADVLVAKIDGTPNADFNGRLGFSWPANPCQTPVNKGDADYKPLFAFDYGLRYSSALTPWQPLSEDTSEYVYGCRLKKQLPAAKQQIFKPQDGWGWKIELPTFAGAWVTEPKTVGPLTVKPLAEGVAASWDGKGEARLILRNNKTPRHDLLPLLANQGALVVDLKLLAPVSDPQGIDIKVWSTALTSGTVDVSKLLATWPQGKFQPLSIDLACFAKSFADFSKIDGPFALQSKRVLAVEINNPRYEPGQAKAASISCSP
ncbi:MAG TPA: glycoside hydrolase family 3 N-terminal domain-containing protein [Cellvibrionaceae bacterium]